MEPTHPTSPPSPPSARKPAPPPALPPQQGLARTGQPLARPPADPVAEADAAIARRAQEKSPLTPEHFQDITRAIRLRRPVMKTVGLAYTSAVVTLAIAVFSLVICLVSFSWLGVFVSLAVLGVGTVEFIGQKRLRRNDGSALRLLALNQLALFGIITVYCVLSMLSAGQMDLGTSVSPEVQKQLASTPGASDMIDSMQKFVPILIYGFYTVVIVTSLAFQGGMALYYFTRRNALDKYQQLTPEWVQRLLALVG